MNLLTLPTKRTMRLLGVALIAPLLLFALFTAAAAEEGTDRLRWEITADTVTRLSDPDRVIAEGNAVLSRVTGAPLVISADWMSYDPQAGTAQAKGGVRISSSGESSSADAASFHLESGTGTLEKATIHLRDDGFYLKGDRVEKTGPETYYLEDAWLSACRPDDAECAPAWAFTGGRVRITVDGMAHIHHSTFRIKERPLLYAPYLLLPAKTKRQSGFLFPEVSFSQRDGFGLNLPYFINLSRSADITLYPRTLSKRGLLAGAEFRYVIAPQSKGVVQVSFLDDRQDDDAKEDFLGDGLLRETRNRYWVRAKADHRFRDDLVARLDLDFTSDQDFIREFDSGHQGYSRSNRDFERIFGRELSDASLSTRRSSLLLNRYTPHTLMAAELVMQQDTRHTMGLDAQGNLTGIDLLRGPLQALPRLSYYGRLPLSLASRPLSLAWNSEYVHYWRSRGIGAQRLDLHPRLITPMPRGGGWLEGRFSVGVRQTIYQLSKHGNVAAQDSWLYDDFQNRTAVDVEANLATTLLREFKLASALAGSSQGGYQRLEHLLRPNLIYTYQSRSSQSQLPSLDGVDRLRAKNWLTFELNNYFEMVGETAAKGDLNTPAISSRPLGFIKLAQSYDLAEIRRDIGAGESRRELSDLRFELQASPGGGLGLRYLANLSMYGQGLTRHELRGSYRTAGGAWFDLGYRYLRYSDMVEPYFYTTSGERRHDLVARAEAPLSRRLKLHGLLNHSLSDRRVVEAILGLVYKPECWSLGLEARRYLDDTSLMMVFSLDNIGEAFGLEQVW